MSKTSKYDITILKNKAEYNGQKMSIMNFKHKDKTKVKRKDMVKFCDEILKSYRKKYADGIIEVSIKYPNRWYSADATYLKDDINYFSLDDYDSFGEDPEEYAEFRMYFIPIVKKAEGGTDKYNDCLINCIKKIIQSHKNEIDAKELKEILGLQRNDKININQLSKVEDYIKQKTKMEYGFYVSGDFQYTTKLQTLKQIHLILSKEHYTLDKTQYFKRKHVATEDKKILVYEYDDDDYSCFDGQENFYITSEDYNHIYGNPITSEYILVDKNFRMDIKKNKLCLEDSYHEYIEMADIIKEKTNGYINFYRCGSIKHMALNLFFDKVKCVFPDNISNIEAEYIHDASFGALTYWHKYEGTIYSYDRNSQYPYLMSRNYNKFPIKEGEFKFIKTIDNEPLYGVYRCKITNTKNISTKFFRFNHRNYYTHLDIITAKSYGLNIELIHDSQANFLYYSDDKLLNGAFLFGHYVNDLYKLKLDKIKGAKDILNILWGALSEMNIHKRNITFDEEIELKDYKILSMNGDESKLNFRLLPTKSKMFKTNWARIKPFILGYGRYSFYLHCHQYEDLVIRINTDGIYFNNKPQDLHDKATDPKYNNKMGFFKYEGEKVINLTGLNKGLK